MGRWRSLVLLGLAAALSAGAVRAQAPEAAHSKIERLDVVYHARSDGTFEKEVEFSIKAITTSGAQTEVRANLQYVAGLQSMEVLAAETIKADGRVIPVRPDAITTQDGAVGQVSRPDLKIISFVFPDLGPGDRKRYRFRLRQLKPELPRGLYLYDALSESTVVESARYEVHLPADAADIRVSAKGFAEQEARRTPLETVRVWTYSNPRARVSESYELDHSVRQPHLLISNAADWQALATQYASLHRAKAQPTAKLRAVVAGLVREGMGEDEKVRALYDWVRKNIRYIALYVGAGGYEPHAVDDILDKRYGDCKDHVVLLEAMLAAAGIDSEPVLIMSDFTSYTLPSLPTRFAFNHVITYIPSLDRYVDSTAAAYPHNVLPFGDADKPVLRVYAGNIKRTPLTSPAERSVVRTTNIKLDKNGDMNRATVVAAHGLAAVIAKEWFDVLAGQRANVLLTKDLQDQGLQGTAQMSAVAPGAENDFSFQVTQSIVDMLPEQEVLVFNPGPANAGRLSAIDFLRRFTATSRTSPMACEPLRVEDRQTVTLGDGLSVLKMPRDRYIESEGLLLKATHRLGDDGRTVQVDRMVQWSPGSTVCSPEQYRALRERMRRVLALYDTGLVLQRELAD